jgi:hypothetical protein
MFSSPPLDLGPCPNGDLARQHPCRLARFHDGPCITDPYRAPETIPGVYVGRHVLNDAIVHGRGTCSHATGRGPTHTLAEYEAITRLAGSAPGQRDQRPREPYVPPAVLDSEIANLRLLSIAQEMQHQFAGALPSESDVREKRERDRAEYQLARMRTEAQVRRAAAAERQAAALERVAELAAYSMQTVAQQGLGMLRAALEDLSPEFLERLAAALQNVSPGLLERLSVLLGPLAGGGKRKGSPD